MVSTRKRRMQVDMSIARVDMSRDACKLICQYPTTQPSTFNFTSFYIQLHLHVPSLANTHCPVAARCKDSGTNEVDCAREGLFKRQGHLDMQLDPTIFISTYPTSYPTRPGCTRGYRDLSCCSLSQPLLPLQVRTLVRANTIKWDSRGCVLSSGISSSC